MSSSPSPPPHNEAQPPSATPVPPSTPPHDETRPPSIAPINSSLQPHDEAQAPSAPAVKSLTNQSTPVKKSLQGSHRFASKSKPDSNFFKARMVMDLKDQFVGPTPVEDLLELLPVTDERLKFKPDFKHDHFSVLAVQDHEKDMYDPFIESVTAIQAMPEFKLVNTSNHSDRKAVKGMKNKPDVVAYKKNVVVKKDITRYQDMELIFEFKPQRDEADPFDRRAVKTTEEQASPYPFEVKAEQRKACRGQISIYARVWLALQHRTHCYIVYIGDPHARIIRFDRSGGLVSAQINYRTESHLLLDFLWRHSQTSDEARGLDTTVRVMPPNNPIVKIAQHKLFNWKPSTGSNKIFEMDIPEKAPEQAAEPKDTNSEAPDPKSLDTASTDVTPESIKMRTMYVWGALAEPDSVTGRATRGYPAWDPSRAEGQDIVFVKDSWRACQLGMEKETDILQTLNKHKVRNVPEYLCGDDILAQKTITQDYAKEDWNLGARSERFVKRAHIRFAEDFVGTHLCQFQSSEQLVQAIYDAYIAHQDAYEKCGILHRDVSAGNILLRRDKKGGILNDWDLAVTYDKETHIPVKDKKQPFRSGTWQFMSAGLLAKPAKVHLLQDDAESFFWVLFYHVLRYMKHSVPIGELEPIMKGIFDQANLVLPGKLETGGTGKRLLILSRTPDELQEFSVDNNEPLTDLIDTTLDMLQPWYQHNERVEAQARKYTKEHKVSKEEAAKKIDIDTSHLDMHNHQKLALVFETALQKTWPANNISIDFLRLKMDKRPRQPEGESDEDDEDGFDTNNDSGSDDLAPKQKRKKGTDDAPYYPPGTKDRRSNAGPSNLGSQEPATVGVQTRSQTKNLPDQPH